MQETCESVENEFYTKRRMKSLRLSVSMSYFLKALIFDAIEHFPLAKLPVFKSGSSLLFRILNPYYLGKRI